MTLSHRLPLTVPYVDQVGAESTRVGWTTQFDMFPRLAILHFENGLKEE